jgi:hypothetical protein
MNMGNVMRGMLLAAALVLVPACGDDGGDTLVVGGGGTSLDWPPSGMLVGLSGGTLVFFSGGSPEFLQGTVPISGVDPDFKLVGIDFRPATRQLYGLAIQRSGATAFRLYAINPSTGAAALAGVPAGGVAGFDPDQPYGIDFNPVVDLLRVVNGTSENARIDPNDGTLASNDTDLGYTAPASGPIAAAAYTNNFPGATTTTLYAIDSGSSRLALIGGISGTPSPNAGAVTSVGPLGVTTDFGSEAALDIAPNGVAFAMLTVAGVQSLYRINLATGLATLMGEIGPGTVTLVDVAVAP